MKIISQREYGSSRRHTQHSRGNSESSAWQDREEHHKRTHDEDIHPQHSHKPINIRTGKESRKDAKHQNQDSRKNKQRQKPN